MYLIAETRGEDSPVAPLFACLASELHYTAALAGSRMPGGRLDPPLLMALDEVTQICPVPVPSWLADSGGKGIQIITVAHGEAQLRGRWGRDGARVIMDTSGAKIWLPGISDPDTLDAASTLCGTAAMREHGEDRHTRHPVMTPEMIRQLPAGRALVIRGGYAPVIARLPMAWKDPTYRPRPPHGHARHRRQARRPSSTLDGLRPAGRCSHFPAHRKCSAHDGGDDQRMASATGPPPHSPWWRIDKATNSKNAIAWLRAWVEQVYRPGYGHLAAALGSCWEQHPLCLYGLDWLMELWSILHLTSTRGPQT